jgi:hypothetical protein
MTQKLAVLFFQEKSIQVNLKYLKSRFIYKKPQESRFCDLNLKQVAKLYVFS